MKQSHNLPQSPTYCVLYVLFQIVYNVFGHNQKQLTPGIKQ